MKTLTFFAIPLFMAGSISFLAPLEARAQVYKYIDDQGSVHYVNDRLEIPEKYREKIDVIKSISRIEESEDDGDSRLLQPGRNPLFGHQGVADPERRQQQPEGVGSGAEPIKDRNIEQEMEQIKSQFSNIRPAAIEGTGIETTPLEYANIQYAFSFTPPPDFRELRTSGEGLVAYFVARFKIGDFIPSIHVYATKAPPLPQKQPTKLLEDIRDGYRAQWSEQKGYITSVARIASHDSYNSLELLFISKDKSHAYDFGLLIYHTHTALVTFQFRLPAAEGAKYSSYMEAIKNTFANDGPSFSQGDVYGSRKRENAMIRISVAVIGLIVFALLFWLAFRQLRET